MRKPIYLAAIISLVVAGIPGVCSGDEPMRGRIEQEVDSRMLRQVERSLWPVAASAPRQALINDSEFLPNATQAAPSNGSSPLRDTAADALQGPLKGRITKGSLDADITGQPQLEVTAATGCKPCLGDCPFPDQPGGELARVIGATMSPPATPDMVFTHCGRSVHVIEQGCPFDAGVLRMGNRDCFANWEGMAGGGYATLPAKEFDERIGVVLDYNDGGITITHGFEIACHFFYADCTLNLLHPIRIRADRSFIAGHEIYPHGWVRLSETRRRVTRLKSALVRCRVSARGQCTLPLADSQVKYSFCTVGVDELAGPETSAFAEAGCAAPGIN